MQITINSVVKVTKDFVSENSVMEVHWSSFQNWMFYLSEGLLILNMKEIKQDSTFITLAKLNTTL